MEGNNLSKLKSVFKVCFKIGNERAYDVCSNGLYFWKRRSEIFFQPSFNDKKTYMKMYKRVLIDTDKQRFGPVFL